MSALFATTPCGMDEYAGADFVRAGDPDPDSPDYLATDCGWTFGGYAASFYDHPDNASVWDPAGVGCGPPAESALGYHLSSTSVSNVYLANHLGGTWRLYFPDPSVVASCSDLDRPFPREVYGYADSTELPVQSDWQASGRFNELYVSFLESADGVTYPVYGPRMQDSSPSSSGCPTRWTALDWSGAGWTATAVPVFTGSLSTDTQIDPDMDGVYVVYRDVSVVDLSTSDPPTSSTPLTDSGRFPFGKYDFADALSIGHALDENEDREARAAASAQAVKNALAAIRSRGMAVSGWSEPAWWDNLADPDIVEPDEEEGEEERETRELYIMVCVETRGTSPFPKSVGDGDCSATSSCISDCQYPFTRVVLFFSESPDFDALHIVPDPGVAADALVILQPDTPSGGVGPERFDASDPHSCPSEWYGVVQALMTPDEESLLVYVPHVGASAPSRKLQRYDCDTYEINDGSWPTWQNAFDQGTFENIGGGSGISCFRLPVEQLRLLAFAVLDATPGPDRDAALEFLRNWLLATTRSVSDTDIGYQGEVLISDGSLPIGPAGTEDQWVFVPCSSSSPFLALDAPTSESNTDPQFVFCGGELYVYWDINNSGEIEATGAQAGADGSVHTQYPQDQLRRARWVAAADLDDGDGHDFTAVLQRNRDYTIFQADRSDCMVAFDMRELFNPGVDPADWASNVAPDPDSDALYGTMVADPTLAVLDDGRLVVHHFGGCNTPSAPPGLLVSYTRSPVC